MKEVCGYGVLGPGAEKDKGHGAVRLKKVFGQTVKMLGRRLTMLCLTKVEPL